jgi:PKD repeat protein
LSDPNIAQPTASPTTTTTYTLTVRDSLSRVSTDIAVVRIASPVVANAGPDRTILLGGSTTLAGSASGGLAPYTYSWTPTTGLSNPNIAQPTASPTVTTTYTLTVTDSLSQVSTDTAVVNIASAVVANAGPDRTIAPGGSTTLAGSASGGLSPYTYSWSPATGLSNPNIARPTASPATTTTYTLTVTDSLSQVSTDTVLVTVTVRANAGPDKTIALGGSCTLEGSAAGGAPPYTYSWTPTTGLSDPNIAQPTASPATTTTYTLTVTDSLSQASTDTVLVTVANLPPTAAFSYAPSSPTTADTVSFADDSSDADGTIVAWAWDFGDGAISSERNPAHRYAEAGDYEVRLSVTDDDGARDSHSALLHVGVEPHEEVRGGEPLTLAYTGSRMAAAGCILGLSASAASEFGEDVTSQVREMLSFVVLDAQDGVGPQPEVVAGGGSVAPRVAATLSPGIYRIFVWFPGNNRLGPAGIGPELAVVVPPGAEAAWGSMDAGNKQFALLVSSQADGTPSLQQFVYYDAETRSEVTSTSLDSVTCNGGAWQASGHCAADGVYEHQFHVELTRVQGQWTFALEVSNGLLVQGTVDRHG